MGKQGPCYHCGVTSTPLWRNGPADKPVLCNACGSRWRTKGTLTNYTPLHARAESDDYEDQRVSRVTKSISINKHQEVNLLKRKQAHDNVVFGGVAPDYNHVFRRVADEDTSNRSSSGSAISNSDNYAQIGSTDASDFTGPAQSVVWDAMVPSKKRTCVNRPKQSAVEKLTKDLCSILHEQQSYFSTSSEDDLLFESETPLVSVEIGHGTVLIRHPSSIAREEESEASSLSVDKHFQMSEAYSYVGSIAAHIEKKGVNFPTCETEKIRIATVEGMKLEQHKRDNSQQEKLQILGNHNSPLQSVELNDIVNYEEFMKHLTREEQQQLLKYLPPVDTVKLPESLKNMFDSSQFKENLINFQHLLAEGVWDVSLVGAKPEDCRTLKRLALTSLLKSKWVGHYNSLKSCKTSMVKSVVQESPATASSNVINVKRFRDGQNQSIAEGRTSVKSPKRAMMKSSAEGKEVLEDGCLFSPGKLFALPTNGSALMLDSFSIVEESSDQDLLLEVPSNGSFPEAELLHPSISHGAQASNSSSSIHPHLFRL